MGCWVPSLVHSAFDKGAVFRLPILSVVISVIDQDMISGLTRTGTGTGTKNPELTGTGIINQHVTGTGMKNVT